MGLYDRPRMGLSPRVSSMTFTKQDRTPRPELTTWHWRHHVRPAVIAAYGITCHICEQPIDMGLKSPHPQSFSIDHLIGPETGSDLRYLRPSHRLCNMQRGDPVRLADPAPKLVTSW